MVRGWALGQGCLSGRALRWAAVVARLPRALGMLLGSCLHWSRGWRAAAAERERRLPVARPLRERMVWRVRTTRLQAPGKLRGMLQRAGVGRLPALERLLVKHSVTQGMEMWCLSLQ